MKVLSFFSNLLLPPRVDMLGVVRLSLLSRAHGSGSARARMRALRCSGTPFVLLAVIGSTSACGVDPKPLPLANPDMARFAEEAYPVLLRDCGFPACHGDPDRFFRVFGPGRTRFMPAVNSDPGDPATGDEITQSYDRARSMIDAKSPTRSLLLRKPLARAAGGAGHKGVDLLGRNVYASTTDPDYQALRNWVLGLPAAGAP
jgi:hypothetical protein